MISKLQRHCNVNFHVVNDSEFFFSNVMGAKFELQIESSVQVKEVSMETNWTRK